jgi:hypothetical protein
MPCPDAEQLELWLAGLQDARAVAQVDLHVSACAACRAWTSASRQESAALTAALQLDYAELRALVGFNLAAAWQPAPPAREWLGLLALLLVGASAAVWSLAERPASLVLSLAGQVGLWSVLLRSALELAWSLGSGLLALATSPVLTYETPALLLFALLLLSRPWLHARRLGRPYRKGAG